MKTILLILSWPAIMFSQINNDLTGMAIINNQAKMARINPNTGNVTVLSTITLSPSGDVNCAVNCSNGDYVIGSIQNGARNVSVMDQNGTLKNSFGYSIDGIAYNEFNNLFYGINSGNFISFDPDAGTMTVISSTNSVFYLPNTGAVIDYVNGRYIFISSVSNSAYDYRVISFSCSNGNFTVSPTMKMGADPVLPYAMSFYNGKLYGLCVGKQGAFFGEILLSTGVFSSVSIAPAVDGLTPKTARGGMTIDENSNTFSVFIGKLYNINILTGQLVSSPSVNVTDLCFIQYSCYSVTTGIKDIRNNSLSKKYFDLFGEKCEPSSGKVLIEFSSDGARKIFVQD